MPESSIGDQRPEVTDQIAQEVGIVESQNLGGKLLQELRKIKKPNEELPILREKLRAGRQAALEKHKDDPKRQELIDSYYQLLGGPLLLHPDTLVVSAGERREYTRIPNTERLLSASIQHRFTRAILLGAASGSSEAYSKNMYQLMRGLEAICDTQYGNNQNLGLFLRGLKSQVAVIKTLLPTHRVYIPDYKNGGKEVMDWDIVDKVDFVAIPRHKGPVLLVDAKGRQSIEKKSETGVRREQLDEVLVETTSLEDHPITQESLQTFIEERTPDGANIHRVRITVPSSDLHIRTTAPVETTATADDYRKQLNNFGTFVAPGIEDELTAAIDELE